MMRSRLWVGLLALLMASCALSTAWAQSRSKRVSMLIDRYVEQREAGKLEEGLQSLLKARALGPRDPWVWGFLGEAYLGLQRNTEAVEALRKALALGSRDDTDRAYLVEALCLVAEERAAGEPWTAERLWNEAARALPDSPRPYLSRGEYYLGENDDQAVKDLTQALKRAPEEAELYSLRAQAYTNLSQFEAAVRDADMALELDPDSALRHSNRADVYVAMGDKTRALSDYGRAIELDPENLLWRLQRIGVLLETADFAAASGEATAMLERQPDMGTIYILRALAALELGDYPQALADADRGAQLLVSQPEPDPDLLRLLRGEGGKVPEELASLAQTDMTALYNALTITAAETFFREQAGSPEAVLLSLRALAYAASGQPEEAREQFERLLAVAPPGDPGRLDVLDLAAASMQRLGWDEQAVLHARAAVELEPSAERQWRLGRSLLHLGRLPEAQVHLDGAVKEDAQATYLATQALLRARQGKLAEAVEPATSAGVKATLGDEDGAELWLDLGLAKAALGETGQAEEAFRRVLRQHPFDARLRNLEAELARLGDAEA